ncbi:hypothetical protein ACFXGR_22385 [Streptomyces mirabilis]|uniref:hypothetical protein n=1 Tax=Streptomyces mirabilis TaxID=68239 RepID=UPI00368BF97A
MTTDDLPARLEVALTERFTENNNPFSAMRRQEKGPDGWPASHPVGPHQVAEVLRELLAAAPVPPSAPTERAAGLLEAADFLRDAHFRDGLSVQEIGTAMWHWADREQPASTAPLAAGLPLVKGNCPACRRSELFLGSGGYVTCSNADCPEPDAATTVLEQYAAEAQPPSHRWYVETRDGVADQWAPGSRILDRHHAVERYEALNENHPTWKDGTPVERRIVRETATYTVEQPAV